LHYIKEVLIRSIQMILIAGNNLSSIYLSAYLEKENIDYRRIYTQKVKDYTFYFNDLNGGMQKRVLDIFDYQMENNGDAAFYVRTNEGEYKIDGNFELFMQNNAAHCKNGDNSFRNRERVDGNYRSKVCFENVNR